MILPTLLQARGFYIDQLGSKDISLRQYRRAMRAIDLTERKMRDADKLRELRRERQRASKAKAKEALRRQLQQSLQECA